MKQLILGGARSGKSQLAEARAKLTGKSLYYLATGSAGDTEMAARVSQHKISRGKEWTLIEEQIQIAKTIESIDDKNHTIVVDCLTLWLSNCLQKNELTEQKDNLIRLLPDIQADVIFVSNEVGSGIVPLGELSREFVDQSGWLHQELGKICDRVTLVVAGLPLELKN